MIDKEFQTKANRARQPSLTSWTHISDAVSDALDMLMAEVEANVESNGGFKGPVRPRQRPWSRTLDQIEIERETAA